MNFFYAVKTTALQENESKPRAGIQQVHSLLEQGFNTIVFMMRVQQPVLAFHTVILLKKFLESQPILKSDRFSKTKYSKIRLKKQVFDKGKVQTEFSVDVDRTRINKSAMIKNWAMMIILRVI